MPIEARQQLLTGMAIVCTENSLNIPVVSFVNLGQVDLSFKIDISETNAGPRWIPNPHSQFITTEDEKPFLLYVHDYQVIYSIQHHEGVDIENTLKKFDA
jgi:hypothetical protein